MEKKSNGSIGVVGWLVGWFSKRAAPLVKISSWRVGQVYGAVLCEGGGWLAGSCSPSEGPCTAVGQGIIYVCIRIKDKEKSSWGLKKLRADSSRNFGSAIRSSISGTISRERSVSRRDFSSRSFYASIFIRGSWIRRGSRVRKLYRSQEKKLDIEYTHDQIK